MRMRSSSQPLLRREQAAPGIATSDVGPHRDSPPRIEDIVATLRDLRLKSHKSRYGAGPLPELPSRNETIAIVDRLIAALFPRHFGPAGLGLEDMDAFVAESLTAALRGLKRQVRLELELADAKPSAASGNTARRADTLVGAFAGRLSDIRALLETDIHAAFEGDPAARSLDEVICCYPGVAAITRHRLAHELYRLGAPMLARIIAEASHTISGIDIHPGAAIGESFFIDHGTGVVIGETAIIGRRVRLYQGVTLGARRFDRDERGGLAKDYPRHPILEDDVVVYAGASILGRITIGRGAVISGSVWVTQDVPAGGVVTQAKSRSETFDGGAGI